jgi:hypothetical protein
MSEKKFDSSILPAMTSLGPICSTTQEYLLDESKAGRKFTLFDYCPCGYGVNQHITMFSRSSKLDATGSAGSSGSGSTGYGSSGSTGSIGSATGTIDERVLLYERSGYMEIINQLKSENSRITGMLRTSNEALVKLFVEKYADWICRNCQGSGINGTCWYCKENGTTLRF